jgi:flavin reductase (DIM6/NTAB) family NADH-FMN oxidoreductase RutF
MPETAITADLFRQGMRRFAGAVNVITAANAGERHGMTATAVCSVTADPPTLLVCINRRAATHDAVVAAGAFCVNVLRAGDEALSAWFGGGQTGSGRFASHRWIEIATGAPALADALAAFDCRVVHAHAHGTHTVFFGRIEACRLEHEGPPLLYASGRYARLAAHEDGDLSRPFDFLYM